MIAPIFEVNADWKNKNNFKRLKGYNISENEVKLRQKMYGHYANLVTQHVIIIYARYDYKRIKTQSEQAVLKASHI